MVYISLSISISKLRNDDEAMGSLLLGIQVRAEGLY